MAPDRWHGNAVGAGWWWTPGWASGGGGAKHSRQISMEEVETSRATMKVGANNDGELYQPLSMEKGRGRSEKGGAVEEERPRRRRPSAGDAG